MAQEIPWETRERAEELYIVEGFIFEDVARETGVSVSQLKRWASDGDWTDRKREYRTAFSNIKRDTVLLRKKLIAKALKSLDPQDVYAISSLESTVARIQGKESAAQEPEEITNPKIIKTPADAVDALQSAVELKINKMLTRPGAISLSGIKETKQALELIEKMKTKYKPEAENERTEGLSDEAAEEIRKQILGITSGITSGVSS